MMPKYVINLQVALICIVKNQMDLKRIIESKQQTKYTNRQMHKETQIETLSFKVDCKEQQIPIKTTNKRQQQKCPQIQRLPSQLDDLFDTEAQFQSYSNKNLIEQYNYLIYPPINDNYQNLQEMDGYRYDDKYYSEEDLFSKASNNLSTTNLEVNSQQRKQVPEKSNITKKQDVNCKNFYQNIFKILQIIFRSVQDNIEKNISNPSKYRNIQKILKKSNTLQKLQLQQIIQGLTLSDTRTNFLLLLKNKYMKAILAEMLLNNQIYMKSYLCRIKLKNRNAFNRKLKNLINQVIRN